MLTSIANETVPSGSGVNSSWDCSCVDRVLVDIYSGWVVPGLIQFWTKFQVYGINFRVKHIGIHKAVE